jgi:S1-C subfamily serine protease
MRAAALAGVSLISFVVSARAQESIAPDVLQKVKQASAFVKVSVGPIESSGSGFVVRTDEQTIYVVTNAHVVARPNWQTNGALPPGFRLRDQFELRRKLAEIERLTPTVSVVLNSGTPQEQVLSADIVAADAQRDLAVLKADNVKSPPAAIELDASFQPTETTPVFTFGFPFGEALSKTKGNPAITVGRGAVSSLRLDERGENSIVQLDGALNPGNSGGPVVDAKGRLVGVAVATIKGAGIGFAIPPATLQRLLTDSLADVRIGALAEPDGLAVQIELTIFDPYRRIKELAIHCVPHEVKPETTAAQQPLEGSRKIDLKIANGKATGVWKIPTSDSKPNVVTVQPVFVDPAGKSIYLAAVARKLTALPPVAQRSRPVQRGPGFGFESPAAPPSPTAGASNIKVNRGATRKVAGKQLSEGVLVFPERSQALGLGVMQRDAEKLGFTYFVLVRLPAGGFNRNSSVVRNRIADNRHHVHYETYLDDHALAIEHLFTDSGAELADEKFVIQGESFQPESGRVFLVDLTGGPHRVMQKKIDLPPDTPRFDWDDEHLADFAQKTRDALLKDHEELRAFVEGKN